MTPFERNLEMWRQLWRVIERSDLIVQIVDARNPLLFRSQDLERYVKEVDPRKGNLLLINKADMMTDKQRKAWADYFDTNGIQYKFFSAALASQQNLEDDYYEDDEEREEKDEQEGGQLGENSNSEMANIELKEDNVAKIVGDSDDESGVQLEEETDPRVRILSANELEELFLKHGPTIKGKGPCSSLP